ncbi:NADPH:quinone reductase [Sphaerisporangium siamense]|uniref:NADPH:quinone reductase-like Zn-dependent oxidoreductase n=1 Tax=Sphaerisporangium siamense TaxID=795645 RepID=A0A7W7G935_9ACTN|nr:NADP-dependent oxidoreductase [Sphaerisporangium siamense]MBB4700194.1 NADPH:quinone reductase-like Zn-dependent oxidoreductase [Sphaerisporangium siamense]GII84493.1 NADPH:quinone reductase [Sphaerisporangium siamense]
MRAITQTSFGDPSVLDLVEVDRPRPGPGQVLIKVGAVGVNPADVAVRAGWYPVLGEPPFTLGWDVAGVIELVGSGVSAFEPGEEVFGLLAFPGAGDTYAEYVLASVNEIARKPTGLTVERAAGLPLAGLTAWQALVGIGHVGAGDRVLVHRAAGGVGHLAVQIAKARGAYVIGTAGEANHAWLRELGADELIDYTATDFVTATAPVDTVFDLVGGEYGARSAAALKPGGLLIGALGNNLGITPEEAGRRGVRLEVVSVRPSAADLGQLSALVDAGRLTVHIDQTLPLTEAAKAHDLIATGHTRGKIVLTP